MGKVYSLSPVELRSGIDREEFEAFARQSFQQLPPLPGWRAALLKVDRSNQGDQVSYYQVLVEIDSIEARDVIAPTDSSTPQQQEWYAAATPILEQWRQYTTTVPGLDAPTTDYHDITDG